MDKRELTILTQVVYKEHCAKEETLYFTDEERQKFFRNVLVHVEALLLVVAKLNK